MRTVDPRTLLPRVPRGPIEDIHPDSRRRGYRMAAYQSTIGRPATLQGVGIHGGRRASITMLPAAANTGIVFRTRGTSGAMVEIPASYRAVASTSLCTELRGSTGSAIATVEHLLAALNGLAIDNLVIDIDGPEVPIMDGSAVAFVKAIDAAGIDVHRQLRAFIKVEKTVRVEHGRAWAELRPYDGFSLDVEIKFKTSAIGHQRLVHDMHPGIFRRRLSCARTFGFGSSVEALWAQGRALGASLANTVAIQDDKVVNRDGLRYADEFVRHKMVDAIGDLALAGAPLLCAFRSSCGGHAINHALLHELFADEDAYSICTASPLVRAQPDRLGVHLNC